MKISQVAVGRPVLTIMVSMIVIILGAVALSRLPIDLMPDVTSPTISVSTSYSKASPLTMEELVTRPIEEALAAVPGVQEISSRSTEGSSNVQVSFSWGTDLEAASNDIRDRLDRIISRLPDEASRPSLRKYDMSATPVIMMGVTSDLDVLELRRILEEQVSYRLERVDGVASVSIWGGRSREIHINIDPLKMNALRIPLDQVISSVRAANINQPTGNIYRGNHQITIRVPGVFENLEELKNTIIVRRGGSVVALKDIAEILDTASKVTRIVRINGQNGIQIAINKQSGTNTVKVVQGVLDEVVQINRSIPQINIIPLMDSSVFIKQSINNVSLSALLGGILAVLILLFFLRNLKSTTVISTAIPISIMATFGLLYFNGFTLNLMTIGALALGVGQLLDNSIVVMENIFRHREMGKESKQAAIEGANEVGSPILASTLTSIVVFLPLLFMRGMSGIMFQQLAFVVVFALICSLATALTLVPMLSSRLIKVSAEPDPKSKRLTARLYFAIGKILSTIELFYKKLLAAALDNRGKTALIALLLLLAAFVLTRSIDSELMPMSDEGEVRVSLDMVAGTKLELVDQKMLEAESRIKDMPEITSIVASAGGGGWGSSNTGSLRISLLSKSDRARSDQQIADEIRARLGAIPGTRVRVFAVSNNRLTRVMGGGGGRIEIQVRGHEMDEAYRLAGIIMQHVESVDGITDVNLSRTAGAPEDLVIIDRVKAAELGMSVQQISATLETVLSGRSAGDYLDHGKEYPIMVQVKDADQMPIKELLDLSVSNSDGVPIVLRNVVSTQSGESSTVIERVNQERMIDVSANISGRNLSAVIGDIQNRLDEIPVPIGFSVEIVGDYKEQQESFRELFIGIILALVLIYMVMASQFESIRDPFIVMFSVPFALIGVSLILFITGTTFNIQTYIGIIMLAGIVVNNAILLVNTTNQLREHDNMKLREAIEEAGRRRLRPILMTALSTVLGLLPMAIGMGEGSETQAPLARAVVGGLLSSTLITLVVIPVLYSAFEGGLRDKSWSEK
ncbi:MAG: efflux RND transporter permease subunit [Candidatus Cloacimonadaceae bacterium]|nr:efflux RND transporter permease subunit [Candidatus Cloacimonadota bacterium]MDY0380651.1 efflux RND transporter permease subunit [Candidatus Cloacimonadaceae bacterium]MCB5263657.1 efflux RND transporter permease subunit [Candidatus Cloacimonadota bacterium]MCB5276124.1 efflux RND transporter permease subunit [Candidatus Cloacimonadota bacterium]MCK9433254.1 efflux RND transporter permease subunit [Candidatus Cloacimonadota bacterium]